MHFALPSGVCALDGNCFVFGALRLLLCQTMRSPQATTKHYELRREHGCAVMRLVSPDGTNRLSSAAIIELHQAVTELSAEAERGQINALIITGNDKFFSAGADLNEIVMLSGSRAFEFSKAGQRLTLAVDRFPAPVIAAIEGYCMGGGMDLALACDYRIAAPNAVFGHRGASLGLITGWGGTQRLPRLIGKARALQMFLLAEMVPAEQAKRIGLVDEMSDDPVQEVITSLERTGREIPPGEY
jgi:enoyl-CoA hydratase/carnithine racemase